MRNENFVLDQSLAIERNFEAICRIPHGSFHEMPLSDYLVSFAEKLGLRYKQYKNGNVIICKGGSPGRENEPPVMLQAHIDMVCEKAPGCTHDFEKDPLDLYVEDGLIRARGTTLGADDGVGVAYMMSILENDDLSHPPLECVFTVQEEVGCIGAAQIDMNDLKSFRMIGLDDISGGSTTICGAGGCTAVYTYKADREECAESAYVLKVDGLTGGHSGDQIHLERANAIKLAARIFDHFIKEGVDFKLISLNGGGKANSIPRLSEFAFSSSLTLSALEEKTDLLTADIKEEYMFTDPDISITFSETDPAPAFSAEDSKNIIEFLFITPDGMLHHSEHIKGLTTASTNLGVIRTEGSTVTATWMSRGAQNSFTDTIARQISLASSLFKWEETETVRSACWKYKEDSPLRVFLRETFLKITGRELELCAEHGGLECGAFSEMRPAMDIVTLGPKVRGYHTFDEYLDRASFAEIYDVLVKVLEQL